MGVDAIGEAVDLIKAGNAPRMVQDESKATYDPPCGDEHAAIDWTKPARKIHNLIRGCDPQPGAHTIWQGKMVRLFDCRLQPANASATPGQILALGAEDLTVAASGGTLVVKKIRGEAGKIAAAEFAKQANLQVGDRLG
jgi:methionyl-tRNA formyltransferase